MNTKSCLKCGVKKPFNEFWKCSKSKDGYAARCIKCKKEDHAKWERDNPDKAGEGQRRWKTKHPEKYKEVTRRGNLKRYNGMTIEDYDELYQKQKGCCPICKKHSTELGKVFHVDHNHITGKVRGLLCNRCNVALGMLAENIDNAKMMVQYISNFSGS